MKINRWRETDAKYFVFDDFDIIVFKIHLLFFQRMWKKKTAILLISDIIIFIYTMKRML